MKTIRSICKAFWQPVAIQFQKKRIMRIVSENAQNLVAKHGPGQALTVCAKRMLFCSEQAPGIRWTIWCKTNTEVKRIIDRDF